jgi:hypothetical protein
MHPEVRFNEIVGWDSNPDDQDPPWPYRAPLDGSLEEEECQLLAEVLAGFTGTQELYWFCLWDGFGGLGLPGQEEGPPRVRAEHRDYLLFTGPVTDATAFRNDPWFQSPNLWWPEDRAWCVSTEIDGYSTYIGAEHACIDALVAHPNLEVLPGVQPEHLVDPSPYPPGGLSPTPE